MFLTTNDIKLLEKIKMIAAQKSIVYLEDLKEYEAQLNNLVDKGVIFITEYEKDLHYIQFTEKGKKINVE